MENQNIYVVASYTHTLPGKLIQARATLKFYNRYKGDQYSHVSLSRDDKLNNMMSFARKEIKNPFHSGLIKEDIRKGLFAINPFENQIAIMQMQVEKEEYRKIAQIMEKYYSQKEIYGFNFLGLLNMLLCGRGVEVPNHFFCSQWVATVLKESGIDLFPNKKAYNVRPFDFYEALLSQIIYEGSVGEYLQEYLKEDTKKVKVMRK